MLINAKNLDSLYSGFSAVYSKGFGAAETYWQNIAMKVPSTTREENYGWMGQIPRLTEWIGDRQVKRLVAHGYKIKNRDFAQTLVVGRNDIEDDAYGVFTPLFAEMGRAAAEFPDELCFGLLKNGFTELGYDGKAFFAADHEVGAQTGNPTTASNVQTGSGEPWFLLDTSKAIRPMIYQERAALDNLAKLDAPTDPNVFWRKEYVYGSDGRCNVGFGLWQLSFGSKAELTAENYAAARAAMGGLKGDEGRPLNVKGTVLVCGPALEEQARMLLIADTNDGTSNPWKGSAEPIITSWLS